MSDLAFSQPERRSFLVPGLIAFAIVAAGIGFFLLRMPYRLADLTVTHTAVLPNHIVFATDTKLVGAQDHAEDAFYVLTTVRIDNHLKIPLFINDITATLTAPDESTLTASAIEKNDLPNLYTTFPALKPLASDPLLRESSIPPGGHAEGMVLVNFPVTEADWNKRKSATVTVTFYHQGTFTVTIPKP
jgi:hypothetical protein